MIVYPTDNYDSWLSEDDADSYFETRLNAEPWDSEQNREAALQTAFRSINALDLTIVLDDDKIISSAYYTSDQISEILTALQQAQAEQCLHELVFETEGPGISSFSLGGLLSAKLDTKKDSTPRYSERAFEYLRPWLRARTVARVR